MGDPTALAEARAQDLAKSILQGGGTSEVEAEPVAG